jgi:hypothetical protein
MEISMKIGNRRPVDVVRVNPNPRIVWLLNYALDEIILRLSGKDEYAIWFTWAASWKSGQRRPGACVSIAEECFDHKGWGLNGEGTDPVWHTLGQLAWGAKEACYDTPNSGWLVIRYIADAMVAFGVAFPQEFIGSMIEYGAKNRDDEPEVLCNDRFQRRLRSCHRSCR